jgi:hypothetical protein
MAGVSVSVAEPEIGVVTVVVLPETCDIFSKSLDGGIFSPDFSAS